MNLILKTTLWTLLLGILAGVVTLSVYIFVLISDVPQIDSITHYKPKLTTKVYDSHAQLIGEYYDENRDLIEFTDVPPLFVKALIASEDQNFYEHQGLDWLGIIRAMIANIKAGRVVQGGSTITQQVTKSLLLSPERKLSRKIKEAYLAYKIEMTLSKDEILTLYLNQIYFGRGAYGIRRAAWTYFRKSVNELDLAEISLLAGMPQAPSKYNPLSAPELAKHRQHYVLNQMALSGAISQAEADRAEATPILIYDIPHTSLEQAPHFVEYIRRELLKMLPNESVTTGGWQIQTSLDVELQKHGQRVLVDGLRKVDKRRGYRGPLTQVAEDALEETLANLLTQNFQSEIDHYVFTPEASIEKVFATTAETPEVDKTYKCLVLAVEEKQAKVSNGVHEGIIYLKTTKWARPVHPKVHYSLEPVRDLNKVLAPGDVIFAKVTQQKPLTYILEQEPLIEGALLSIHIPTGRVISMIGGKDFKTSQFNRTYQAMRQLGSTIKPIIYSKALEMGLPPNTIIVDAPIIYESEIVVEEEEGDESEAEEVAVEKSEGDLELEAEKEPEMFVWKPDNYEESFLGDITLREAMIKSRNVPTIKLVQSIGVNNLIEFAQRLGIHTDFPRDLSLSLGTISVSLWDILHPYSVFANGGQSVNFHAIESVQHPITSFILHEEAPPPLPHEDPVSEQVISPQLSFLITRLLRDVVTHGTARGINYLGAPFAGKTGTTNDFNDAWFIGFTPDIITGIWVGFDTPQYIGIGEAGSRAAAPIWLDFMKEVVKKHPVREFEVPAGIEFAWVDPKTGLVGTPSDERVQMAFFLGTVPEKPKVIAGFERIKAKDLPAIPQFIETTDEGMPRDLTDESNPLGEKPQQENTHNNLQNTAPKPVNQASMEELIFGQYE